MPAIRTTSRSPSGFSPISVPGSIAVLHEGMPKRRGVVATTDELLAGLTRNGLTAVTVSELVALRR